MRAILETAVCLTLGALALPIPFTAFFYPVVLPWVGSELLAWNLLLGVGIGVVVGPAAALSIRGIGSLRWAGGVLAAIVAGIVIASLATTVAALTMSYLPPPFGSGADPAGWFFGPSRYVGLVAGSFGAVAVGQSVRPRRRTRPMPVPESVSTAT